MSKTPRTEAAKFRIGDSNHFAVHVMHVEQLETELNEAHQAFVIATDQLVQVQGELRQAREENARLRRGLERIALARYYTNQTAESIARKLLAP